MNKIPEPIITLLNNPLTNFFLWLGFNAEWAAALSAGVSALVLWLLFSWLKQQQQRLRNNKIAKDLKPEFDYLTIKRFRDIFIPTRYARISPNRYDNPHEAYKHNEPGKLIPFMLKTSFNEKVESEKFYLILGDSGMGKTAFMVNLYMAFHSFFSRCRHQKMRLLRFQPPDIENPVDIIDRLKAIKDDEAKNTILLLDGLDEDPFILSKDPNISDDQAFKTRLNKIISQAMRFCDVVITCRTQYFPQEELKDYELDIRRPDGMGMYKLNKYYLFPFSNREVRTYLRKKYGLLSFWNWGKKRKAVQLVNNSYKLMSRPMLMSYLDDLVGENKKYRFSYEIYETLIAKWLERESKKWKKSADQERFKIDLGHLARKTALQIYQNWLKTGSLNLAKDDALGIATSQQIPLRPDEVTGKSLLTCDPYLNWKFAHKSILEYFLARECADYWQFASDFKFAGMDVAEHFYKEMIPVYYGIQFMKVKGGTFKMGDELGDLGKECLHLHDVTVNDFYIGKTPVTQKQWRDLMGTNPSHFKDCDNCPVENVNWNDAQQFIKTLSAKTGLKFRLPTEAEWEYAARGGDKSLGYQYAGSNDIDSVAWYKANSGSKTHPVGTKGANELGIYDLSGNVWEWCQDKWHDNYKCAPTDGSAWETGDSSLRVLRGGTWNDGASDCRSAYRSNEAGVGREECGVVSKALGVKRNMPMLAKNWKTS